MMIIRALAAIAIAVTFSASALVADHRAVALEGAKNTRDLGDAFTYIAANYEPELRARFDGLRFRSAASALLE